MHAILLGILEGITEFLPISSTGHLILAEHLFALNTHASATFTIAIQLGAILSVVSLYPSEFLPYIKPKTWKSRHVQKIIVSMIPACILGFLLHDFIKTHLFSPLTVAFALGIGGIAMIVTQRATHTKARTTETNEISIKQAFLIGCVQCLSLWPGMSRSASTIMGGLWAKLDYKTAAKFSFIISVPIMSLAVTYDLLTSWNTLSTQDIQQIAIGFITAYIVAFVSIKLWMRWINHLQLTPFGIYRIILSLILLGVLL